MKHQVTVVGMDIAKNVFRIHACDRHGKPVLKRTLTRGQVLTFFANIPPCVVGLEAGGGAHYWARELRKLGHDAKVMPARYVRPYVKTNKNDAADAEGICEAVLRPTMRFVSVKSSDQQEIQMVHRARQRVVTSRTALINEIRGLLTEFGIVLPRGAKCIVSRLRAAVSQKKGELTNLGVEIFQRLLSELETLEKEVSFYDDTLRRIAKEHPVCKRLTTVPGVGFLTATAILSSVADPQSFRSGRQFAAWLGLVPRQNSSGGKDRLLGISKRGDKYLRTLLVHGARSMLRFLEGRPDRVSIWTCSLIARRGKNRAAVALANKNARAIWSILTRDDEVYRFAIAA